MSCRESTGRMVAGRLEGCVRRPDTQPVIQQVIEAGRLGQQQHRRQTSGTDQVRVIEHRPDHVRSFHLRGDPSVRQTATSAITIFPTHKGHLDLRHAHTTNHRRWIRAYLNVIPNLTRGGAPYAIIENVVVDEAHRGQGIGKQIMAATLDVAWDAGCYKAELTTGSQRESTHAFYRACGMSSDSKTAFIARPI